MNGLVVESIKQKLLFKIWGLKIWFKNLVYLKHLFIIDHVIMCMQNFCVI